MKKIIVAGAGHGGLTAAYHLSKNGYDVTVIEKQSRDTIGYDWHDSIDLSAFDESGIPRPNENNYTSGMAQAFLSPSCKTKIDLDFVDSSISIDRKFLINYLLDHAENAGVKLVFDTEIVSPISVGTKITGLTYKKDGEIIKENCDLLIDAAGLRSPVRSNLPRHCGILRTFAEKDIFYAYRVYYSNPTEAKLTPPYNVHVFHMNRPGIDWFFTEENRSDILIGKFGMSGKLTQKEVDEGIADFLKKYPFTENKVLRGGQMGEIPLRRMLSKIVCDGYAAVGDSAGMTVPLNGSGIVLSMKAGKILADTVIDAGKAELTTEKLWPYQYNYYMTLGKNLILIDVLKNFFPYVNSKLVEFFMEKGILTKDNLAFAKGIKLTVPFILHVATVSIPICYLTFPLVHTFKLVPLFGIINKMMPKEYDEEKFRKWEKLYNKI